MRWSPSGIARHYGVPTDLDGSGQTIAIVNLGETLSLDELRKDFDRMGRTVPDIEVKLLAGFSAGTPDGAIETHIDIEVIASLCPKASLKVYCCAASLQGLASGIHQSIDDNVDVISVSWGWAEADPQLSSADIQVVEAALDRSRAKKITVCAASGDFGASGLCDRVTKLPVAGPDSGVSCTYPASSALVLACGGTTIIQDRSGKLSEVVWNDTDKAGRATGGGVSVQIGKPDWQQDIDIPSASEGSDDGRIVPDVAAVASMVWEFKDRDGQTDIWGGTSAVAPFYAALVALANQRRKAMGKKRLGFLNERLYRLARHRHVFVDIVSGHNRVLPDGLGYNAQAGFDACTGWGVPRANNLINELALLP